jgi:hypothetical protein
VYPVFLVRMVKMAQKVRRVRWERLVPLARMEQMVLVAPPVPRDPLVLPVPPALANAYLLLPPLSPKR